MTNNCRFCKVLFKTEKADQNACQDCETYIKKVMFEDPVIRNEFLETILKDSTTMEKIAKEIFAVPVRNIGIGGDGTVAEYFRKRNKSSSSR